MSYADGGARCQVDARFAREICELISVSANALPDFRRLRTLTKGKPPFTENKKAEMQFTETEKWRTSEEAGGKPSFIRKKKLAAIH
jgi:hypothetical protein